MRSLHICSCNSNSFLKFSRPFNLHQCRIPIIHLHRYCTAVKTNYFPESLVFSFNSLIWKRTQILVCSSTDDYTKFAGTHVSNKPENENSEEREELELLGKPTLVSESQKPDKGDDDLDPFLKLSKVRDSNEDSDSQVTKGEELQNVAVEYYEPKPGDVVVGVVVSGDENKLDVNVGADLLGAMLTKEVLPLYDQEFNYLLCDMERDAEDFMVPGKMGIIRDEDAVSGELIPGSPVVEVGTVLFAEVLGRTFGGRPLLSTRRLFRQVAWHRVRQIKQLSEPIQVRITEWNVGGLLTRIEGLRAFLPKGELVGRFNTGTDLKENVGRWMHVLICRIDEATNDIIISEKEAWEMLHLQNGTLLEGTVQKIFPYGAQIRIGETNRSGLLHISRISRIRVGSVSDLLKIDEKVKVIVVKSTFPDKISLSISDLESEPGLFLSNKERVYHEAEEMAKKYRQKQNQPVVSAIRKLDDLQTDSFPFNDKKLCSNWKWFKFERDNSQTQRLL